MGSQKASPKKFFGGALGVYDPGKYPTRGLFMYSSGFIQLKFQLYSVVFIKVMLDVLCARGMLFFIP